MRPSFGLVNFGREKSPSTEGRDIIKVKRETHWVQRVSKEEKRGTQVGLEEDWKNKTTS